MRSLRLVNFRGDETCWDDAAGAPGRGSEEMDDMIEDELSPSWKKVMMKRKATTPASDTRPTYERRVMLNRRSKALSGLFVRKMWRRGEGEEG